MQQQQLLRAAAVPPARHAAARRRGSARVCANLDPDNASFLIAGGGGVALEVTRQLKDMGSWVWQLQRTDARRWVLGFFLFFLISHGGRWVMVVSAGEIGGR